MKLDYSKPELTRLGTIGELTGQTSSGGYTDATLSQHVTIGHHQTSVS